MRSLRPALLALASVIALLAAPLALAHSTHGPCTSSWSVATLGVVHVDLYGGNCWGASATAPNLTCGNGMDPHFTPGVHGPIPNRDPCEVGVLVSSFPLPLP